MEKTGGEGKDALKFLFTVTLKQCIIKVYNGWSPVDLQISWKRGERRKSFEQFKERQVNNDGEEIHVDFDDGSVRNMLVTLYKNELGFECKEYIFILEEVNGPLFKRLALFSFNIADYVSMNYESFPLNMTFKILSQYICDVSLEAYIRCEFLKTGSNRDSDMISNFSHLSDSDSDSESESDISEVNNEVAILKSRAYKTRSKCNDDLEQKKYESSSLYQNIMSFAAVPIVREEIQKGLSSLRLSFDKRKGRNDASGSDIKEMIHHVQDDDFLVNKSLQIQKLQLDNAALHVKNAHLVSLVDTYKEDNHSLQADIGDLHKIIQDLRLKRRHSGVTQISSTSEKGELNGWLCKQGVKGGPLGRRMKRRWFCLEEGLLYYYKYPGREQPQGFIDLERIVGVEDICEDEQDKNNGSFNIMTSERIYRLTSRNEQDKRRWINMLDYLCATPPRLKTREKADDVESR